MRLTIACQAQGTLSFIVWGPLKYLLQTTFQLKGGAFDWFLTACERIGRNAPPLRSNLERFPECDHRQQIIVRIHTYIIEFYCETIKFFGRRASLTIFEIGRLDLEDKIRCIVDDIQAERKLLDITDIQDADVEKSHGEREDKKRATSVNARERVTADRELCRFWLGSSNVDPRGELEDARARKTKSTGSWLVQLTELRQWICGRTHLWLHGSQAQVNSVT